MAGALFSNGASPAQGGAAADRLAAQHAGCTRAAADWAVALLPLRGPRGFEALVPSYPPTIGRE